MHYEWSPGLINNGIFLLPSSILSHGSRITPIYSVGLLRAASSACLLPGCFHLETHTAFDEVFKECYFCKCSDVA